MGICGLPTADLVGSPRVPHPVPKGGVGDGQKLVRMGVPHPVPKNGVGDGQKIGRMPAR